MPNNAAWRQSPPVLVVSFFPIMWLSSFHALARNVPETDQKWQLRIQVFYPHDSKQIDVGQCEWHHCETTITCKWLDVFQCIADQFWPRTEHPPRLPLTPCGCGWMPVQRLLFTDGQKINETSDFQFSRIFQSPPSRKEIFILLRHSHTASI